MEQRQDRRRGSPRGPCFSAVDLAVRRAGGVAVFFEEYFGLLARATPVPLDIKAAARAAERLPNDPSKPSGTRIGELLSHFPQNECENYFRAAGYKPT